MMENQVNERNLYGNGFGATPMTLYGSFKANQKQLHPRQQGSHPATRNSRLDMGNSDGIIIVSGTSQFRTTNGSDLHKFGKVVSLSHSKANFQRDGSTMSYSHKEPKEQLQQIRQDSAIQTSSKNRLSTQQFE